MSFFNPTTDGIVGALTATVHKLHKRTEKLGGVIDAQNEVITTALTKKAEAVTELVRAETYTKKIESFLAY